ncbi:hypothetical protein PhCBS80983_g04192 [Powellomyces hirtus]|uniref:Uncharacterized protein n=1 Tax=Powellomyces hirtus TaxID=109895 RepID=A0A507DZ63_9FUNG|nr:hypothetical protein PhCBS80983_g04192 [Powellomyces hirtus]
MRLALKCISTKVKDKAYIMCEFICQIHFSRMDNCMLLLQELVPREN